MLRLVIIDEDSRETTVPFIRDEISIGRYSSFNDFCQSPHTVAAFREWLLDHFGQFALPE